MAKFSEPNTDGTVIATLDKPIELPNGEETSRVTIPSLTGRHVMAITWVAGDTPTLGELSTWAASLVLPAGAFQRLTPRDALEVASRCGDRLGEAWRETGGSAVSP